MDSLPLVGLLPVESAEDFAIYLLSEFEDRGETVMVAPGQGFYSSPLGRDEIRIAYVLKEPDLRTLTRQLTALMNEKFGYDKEIPRIDEVIVANCEGFAAPQ